MNKLPFVPEYFTSDLHFYHHNIVKFYPNWRQPTIEKEHEYLIKKINETVPHDSWLVHMGDFAMTKSKTKVQQIRDQIKCKMVFVKGNHDVKFPDEDDRTIVTAMIFSQLKDGTRFYGSHFPLATWAGQKYGVWNLHGHCHGARKPDTFQIDVGRDAEPTDQVVLRLCTVTDITSCAMLQRF